MKCRNAIRAAGLWLLLGLSGCTVNQLAIFVKPEAMAPSVPRLIEKNEAKLKKNPDDLELILDTGSLHVMYAAAFLQGPAEMLPVEEYLEKEQQLAEARKHYLRGAEILASGLEIKHPGWGGAYGRGEQDSFLAQAQPEDVPLIYWHAVGVLSAYAMNPFDLDLGMRLPELTAAIARAYELDPGFNRGALDDFYVLFYSSVPEGLGGDPSKVEAHYRLALEKTGGLSPGPYVSYAQAVCVPAQDVETFKKCLEAALKVDLKKDPGNRLANIISQRKARYLLNSAPEFFAELDPDDWPTW